MDLFNWSKLWTVAGPIIIGLITIVIIGIVGGIIVGILPKGITRELASKIIVTCLVIGLGLSVYIAAGFWGWRG